MPKLLDPLTKAQLSQVRKILELARWNERQIIGQIEALNKFQKDKDCIVSLIEEEGCVRAYISAQYHAWNRLGQIHGLVVHPDHRKRGLATTLVNEIEAFIQRREKTRSFRAEMNRAILILR